MKINRIEQFKKELSKFGFMDRYVCRVEWSNSGKTLHVYDNESNKQLLQIKNVGNTSDCFLEVFLDYATTPILNREDEPIKYYLKERVRYLEDEVSNLTSYISKADQEHAATRNELDKANTDLVRAYVQIGKAYMGAVEDSEYEQ